MARLLVVTAVEAERAAIADALAEGSSGAGSSGAGSSGAGSSGAGSSDGGSSDVTVLVGGVGPASAAAATSAALASGGFGLVLAAGIGGGFAPLVPGEIAVASSIVFADLGAETASGFVPVSELGFGGERYDVDPQLAIELADVTGGRLGTVLTVATVTGTAATTETLIARYPDAVAEAMEGAGVAAAAVQHDVRFAELRAISNVVGPRDRDAWRIPDALAALGGAVSAVCAHAQGWTS